MILLIEVVVGRLHLGSVTFLYSALIAQNREIFQTDLGQFGGYSSDANSRIHGLTGRLNSLKVELDPIMRVT